MATSASIGDLFVITLENDASLTGTDTITVGRPLTVESIELIMLSGTGGTTTFEFNSSVDGVVAEVDMFGGVVASKINNVNLVPQATPPTGGTSGMTIVPVAGQTITAAGGTLSITIAAAGATYLCRFYCSALTPAALTVTST